MNEQYARQQEAQLAQAVMMSRFKETAEYQLMKNTFEVMRLIWAKQRIAQMKTQSMRETMLYFTGKEDAVMELLESIDKIIADGDAIRQSNELMRESQEAK